MNKKLKSELSQKFRILDSRGENNKLKIITVGGLTSLIAIISLSNIGYESKENKIANEVQNISPQVQKNHKENIIETQRENSQQFLKTAKAALKELERFNLKDWNPVKRQELDDLIKNGESMHRLRRYFEANKLFKEIIIQSNDINSLIPKILENKIQNGYLLLEKSKALNAIESFSYALKIEPQNEEALKGMKTATNFDRVQSLFIQADEFETLGQNADALDTYYKIIQLDPSATKAQYAINRIQLNEKEIKYKQFYNKGQTLLQSKKFKEAEESFQEAHKIFPKREEIKDALSEALRAKTDHFINKYITRARVASKQHDWPNAIKDYNKALKLDNSLKEAKKELAYSIKRDKLNQQVVDILNNEEQPLKYSTFEHTKNILKLALTYKDKPAVASQIDKLNNILAEMKRKVPVLIISDGKTYIQLENNIDLGSFKSEKIMLDPGEYLFLGTRTGFHEVFKNFIISTDKKDNRVYIICKQKQRI